MKVVAFHQLAYSAKQAVTCLTLHTLAALFVVVGTSAPAPVLGQAAPSVQSGVYTEEQAVRGQALYYQHCIVCHGENLAGVDKAPPLAGPQFSSIWNGESLWALVDSLDTMPPDKPGSLSRETRVDLLAYMLWYNGLPLGQTPLAAEQPVLEQIPFQSLQSLQSPAPAQ